MNFTAADAPTLVALACAAGAVLVGLLGWITGAIKALRSSATRRSQVLGTALVTLGSLGFITGMAGVRWSAQIADHALDLLR